MAEDTRDTIFDTRTIAWVVVAGVIAFLGFIWLVAYAPQMRMRSDGGPQVMSKSAIGFYGLAHLAELTGRSVEYSRDQNLWRREGLMIVTLEPEVDIEQLKKLIAIRSAVDGANTLYILPKWQVMAMPFNRKWVQNVGTIDAASLQPMLAALGRLRLGETKTPPGDHVRGRRGDEMAAVDVAAPPRLRYLDGDGDPLLRDSGGRTVLTRIDRNGIAADYVVADPDLLSNLGLKTVEGARAAMAIIDAIRQDENDTLGFDLVLNGLGAKRNLLQLMFEPPFLALTIAVLTAALLVGIHAFGRFGPVIAEPRAIPFGKRALADNAAVLIARAGAERRLGDRYVALVRDSAAAALGASMMAPDGLERWLAGLPHGGKSDFATLAQAVRGAPNAHAMQAAAQDLFQWKKDMIRDG